jgi:hypothetical protein
MHQVSVHVLFQHLRIDEVLAGQISDLLLADELVLIIYHFAVLFFQLFGDVVYVRNPLWTWAELRYEITADLRLL